MSARIRTSVRHYPRKWVTISLTCRLSCRPLDVKGDRVRSNRLPANLQLFQHGISLEAGARYRICLWGYSNTARDLELRVHEHGGDYTNYGLLQQVDLTDSWELYTVEFDASGFSGIVGDARLRIWFAPYGRAGDVYRIDNLLFAKLP